MKAQRVIAKGPVVSGPGVALEHDRINGESLEPGGKTRTRISASDNQNFGFDPLESLELSTGGLEQRFVFALEVKVLQPCADDPNFPLYRALVAVR